VTDFLAPTGGEHRVEDRRKLGVVVAEQEPQAGGTLVEVHQHVAGMLGHPGAGRIGGHSGDVDLAGGDLDEEQHIAALEQHRVDREEVAGQDRVGLGGQELFPGRSGPA
jgi:hypothetical protein